MANFTLSEKHEFECENKQLLTLHKKMFYLIKTLLIFLLSVIKIRSPLYRHNKTGVEKLTAIQTVFTTLFSLSCFITGHHQFQNPIHKKKITFCQHILFNKYNKKYMQVTDHKYVPKMYNAL